MPARLGRRYVPSWLARNPQPAPISYNDPVSGQIPLTGTRTETHAKDEGTKTGTISLSGSRTESNTHTVTVTGTIPLSGNAGESYTPPATSGSSGQRPRVGYGD